MHRTILTVEGHSYVLAEGTDALSVKAEVERAVVAGGRFVDLTMVGDAVVSVLISPGVAVTLASLDVPDDDQEGGATFEDHSTWDIADLL